MKQRIGPAMAAVAFWVKINPGKPKMHAARFVGPHQSLRYGYAAVNRALKAGLIVGVPGPRRGTVLLYPPSAGLAWQSEAPGIIGVVP